MWNNYFKDTVYQLVMESDSWETENKHYESHDCPNLLTWEYFQATVQTEESQQDTCVELRVQGDQNG